MSATKSTFAGSAPSRFALLFIGICLLAAVPLGGRDLTDAELKRVQGVEQRLVKKVEGTEKQFAAVVEDLEKRFAKRLEAIEKEMGRTIEMLESNPDDPKALKNVKVIEKHLEDLTKWVGELRRRTSGSEDRLHPAQ